MTRGKVFLMRMVRQLYVSSGWACCLAATLVRVGLLRKGAMALRATLLSHLSSQLLIFLSQLLSLLEQWLHTTLIFFLLSFHSDLPSLEVVSHSSWLGSIRCIGHHASMLFLSFPQMTPMLLHDQSEWFLLAAKSWMKETTTIPFNSLKMHTAIVPAQKAILMVCPSMPFWC